MNAVEESDRKEMVFRLERPGVADRNLTARRRRIYFSDELVIGSGRGLNHARRSSRSSPRRPSLGNDRHRDVFATTRNQ